MKQMVATEQIEKLEELQPIEPGDIDDEIELYLQNLTENPLTYVIGLNNDGVLVKGTPSGGATLYIHNVSCTYGASPTFSQYLKLTIINDSSTKFTTLAQLRDYIASKELDSFNRGIMATGFITIDNVHYHIISIGALTNNNGLRGSGYKLDGTSTTTEIVDINIASNPFSQMNVVDVVIQL